MKNQQLTGILREVNRIKKERLSDENRARLKNIEYSCVAMLIFEGEKYELLNNQYQIRIEKDAYVSPISYLHAYLGKTSSFINQKTSSYSKNKVLDSNIVEVEDKLSELERIEAELYEAIVLKEVSNIPMLKEKISELSKENFELKKKLEDEINKVRGLENKINIILGNSVAITNNRDRNIIEENTNEIEVVTFDYDESDEKKEDNTKQKKKNKGKEYYEDILIDKTEYGIFPYKEDIFEMSKHEFCFIYNRLILKNENNIETDFAEVLVVPLSTRVKYPDLMIWTTHDKETTTYITKDIRKTEIDFGTFSISIEGIMKGKTFKCYINKIQDETNNVLEINRQSNGNQGHLYLAHCDSKIHVCPVTFSNNEDGYADFVYCIENNGDYIAFGDNSEGDVFFIDDEGKNKKLLAKWQDNTLYGAIMEEDFDVRNTV